MEQKISEPSHEIIQRIEAQRNWVKNHYDLESQENYNDLEGKLFLLDTILKSKWIDKDETIKLQSLGVTFGDAFVQELGFEWVQVEDEYGIDPAIKLPGTSIILFVLTMISKRIEKGEEVNIYELYQGIKKQIMDIKPQDK